MPPQTLKLAPNVPVVMEIKYVDIWPNDPAKNNGKGYGAAVSLRGIVNGEDVRVYPKGFVDRALQTLISADVIELGQYDDDPDAKYSIPVLDGKKVQLMLAQDAGEKYPTFTALNLSRVTTPPKTAPKTPENPLAGHDDGYLASLVGDKQAFAIGAHNDPRAVQAAPVKKDPVERMKVCLGAAAGIAKDAKAIDLNFGPEDIRAIGVSLFIDGYGR